MQGSYLFRVLGTEEYEAREDSYYKRLPSVTFPYLL